ncbi:Gdt1 [Gracilaria domingensis]|nr:Gdt1 [Gracilaria domingensis]
MVSYVVSRGAMNATSTGIATASAPALPALPQFPSKSQLPERIQSFVKPFTQSFGVVFLSEFGDKSMFATALMGMKHDPFLVCLGAFAALTVMTFIACFLRQLMQYLSSTVIHYSSIALFAFFGLQMILQARNLSDTPGTGGGERADAEELVAQATVAKLQSPLSVLAKVSSLIFVAEWCDRSMITTMALAVGGNVVVVIGGATLANVVFTGMAVCAAMLVASRISERMAAHVAGMLFEFFAVFTYLDGPEGQ